MKPVLLELVAVGPYVGNVRLDFRVLGASRLFLLHGPTGAGKTMLLDAMCFALFGETTGGRRTTKSLRSHHAAPEVLTSVQFEFTLGARAYRVWRQPEQDRPRKRGGGVITEAMKATLWELREAGGDVAHVLAARPQEVNDRVQELLGFSAEQFRNVTVLPQGEFQKFLHAPSQEREQILEVLFRTGRYRDIAEGLAARESTARRAYEQLRDQVDAVLRNAEVESAGELPVRLAGAEERLAAAGVRVEELRLAQQQAAGAVTEAREQDRRLRERAAAGTAYDALAARQAEFARKAEEAAAARRAAPIEPLAEDARRRGQAAESAAAQASEAETALRLASQADEEQQRRLAEEEAREPERQRALLEVQRLAELSNKVAQLAAAQAAEREAARRHTEASAQLVEARGAVEVRRAALQRNQEDVERLTAVAAQAEKHRAEVAELDRMAAARKQLREARGRLAAASAEVELCAARLAVARADCEAKRERLEEMDRRWMEAQAAILAHALRPDAPCPVCGSREHPAPAVSDQPLPGEPERKRARQALTTAETERDAAAAAERDASLARARAETDVARFDELLGDATALDDGARTASARQALEGAERAARDLAARRGGTEALRSAVERDEAARQRCEDGSREAETALGVARAVVGERALEIPEELRDRGALAKAQARAQKQDAALKEALVRARQGADGARQQRTTCESQLGEKLGVAEDRRREAAEAGAAFERALGQAGFVDAEAFRAARREAAKLAELEAAIEKFRGDLQAAGDRLARAREAADGLRQPDVAALEEALRAVEALRDTALREQAALGGEVEQWRRQMGQVERLAAERDAAEARHRVVAMLSQTAAGRNDRRITLQRFVQVTLLERVLAAASLRLQTMSSGRYWLRVAQENVDRRSAGGLDLEILDAHTGCPRRVSTLSGGESFLASLALALGLSDVVQSQAGGSHLESIFVDEGFGTLDPETLDLALATLRDLQQGGRLVGIISHVPDLQQQIDVRLEVKKEVRGSTARFVVAGGRS